jgi:N-acetylmuramic acid 6-phosphate etherase
MKPFEKITEKDSEYRHLERMSTSEILQCINQEDKKVPGLVAEQIPKIASFIEIVVEKIQKGGRLFYIGSGTSGRLGILDASECPSTFGVLPNLVNGIIAGGDIAMREAVDFAEDDERQGWLDLVSHQINETDVVLGIAASGTTKYVIGAIKQCKSGGITTGSISCNPGSPLSDVADFPIEIIVGPEFVTGSSRMKAGTAQKLILNMISTSVMIRLGFVEDNKMTHMHLTNQKLIDRGVRIIMQKLNLTDYEAAEKLLAKFGSIKKTLENYY